ncbi:unnamed protein product [Scytosiphon promiscuus]
MADCGVVEETMKSLQDGVEAVRKLNREIEHLYRNGTINDHHHRDNGGNASPSGATIPASLRNIRRHNNTNGVSAIELPVDRGALMVGGGGGSVTPVVSSVDNSHSSSSQGGGGGGGGGRDATASGGNGNIKLGGDGGSRRGNTNHWLTDEAKYNRRAESPSAAVGPDAGTATGRAAAVSGVWSRQERYGGADTEPAPQRSKRGMLTTRIFPAQESRQQHHQHEHQHGQAGHDELRERMARAGNTSNSVHGRGNQERGDHPTRDVPLQLQQLRQRYRHACHAWVADAKSAEPATSEGAAGGAAAGRAETRADRAGAQEWGSEASGSRNGAAFPRPLGDAARDSPVASRAPSSRAFSTRYMFQGQNGSRVAAAANTSATATPPSAAGNPRVTPRRDPISSRDGHLHDGQGSLYDDASGHGTAVRKEEARRRLRDTAAALKVEGVESDRWAKRGFLLRPQQQQQQQQQKRGTDPDHQHERRQQQQQERKVQHQQQPKHSWQQRRAQQLYEQYQEQPRQRRGVDVDDRRDLEMRQRRLGQREADVAFRSTGGGSDGGGFRAGVPTAGSLHKSTTGRRDGNDHARVQAMTNAAGKTKEMLPESYGRHLASPSEGFLLTEQGQHGRPRQPISTPSAKPQQQQQRPLPNVGAACAVSVKVLVRGAEGEATMRDSASTTSRSRSPSPEVRPLTADEVEALRRRGRGSFSGSRGGGDSEGDDGGGGGEDPLNRTAHQGGTLPSASGHMSARADVDVKSATRKGEEGEGGGGKARGDDKGEENGRCGGKEDEGGVLSGGSPREADGDKIVSLAGGGGSIGGSRMRAVAKGPNSRPVTSEDEQHNRWRPVKSDDLHEQIKRARLDVESIGVPERAWKRGRGGWY